MNMLEREFLLGDEILCYLKKVSYLTVQVD